MLVAVLSTWVLIITTPMSGRAPLVHEAQRFATQDACEAFKTQLAGAYVEAERQAAARFIAQGLPMPKTQRTYACEQRS